MKQLLLSGFLYLAISFCCHSQTDTLVVKAKVMDGDTIPMFDLHEISILAPYISTDPEDAKRFAKLVRMVKKVYPYAHLAGVRFNEMNTAIQNAPNHKERKRIITGVENEIKEKYGEELKKLTFSQGKILIKLIDRETGSSSYDVIKEFKGSIMVFFYQNFARIWGYNLKTKYDPKGEDKEIELIVSLIETGQL